MREESGSDEDAEEPEDWEDDGEASSEEDESDEEARVSNAQRGRVRLHRVSQAANGLEVDDDRAPQELGREGLGTRRAVVVRGVEPSGAAELDAASFRPDKTPLFCNTGGIICAAQYICGAPVSSCHLTQRVHERSPRVLASPSAVPRPHTTVASYPHNAPAPPAVPSLPAPSPTCTASLSCTAIPRTAHLTISCRLHTRVSSCCELRFATCTCLL